MARFYAGIHGNRGPSTRMGSMDSGIDGYVQGWQTRISANMNAHDDRDAGYVTIGTGPSNSNGGALRFDFPDINTVVDALGCGDQRIEAIRKRIYAEVERLNTEAPKAVKRAERRRAREERAVKRAEKQRIELQQAIIRDMEANEKARIVRLMRDVELDANGNFEKNATYELCNESDGNLRYADDGSTDIIVSARMPGFKRRWQRFDFNVTRGQWVFSFEPDEIGIESMDLINSGFPGYKVVSPQEVGV